MAMPYLKIEPPDYLNDYAINNLTCAEFGALMRILLLMWQSNLHLQNDDTYIARQINCSTEQWAEVKTKLQQRQIIFLDNGCILSSQIKSKFMAAEAFSRQQREKKQGRKKKVVTD